jgi:hypothetical protein
MGTLSEASKKVNFKISTNKTKYMYMSHHQNARQNNNIKAVIKSFEKLVKHKTGEQQ